MPKNYSGWNQEDLDREVEKVKANFKERLMFSRLKKGLTQEQLAEKLNCSAQTISNWENRNPAPSFETLIKLSKILDCDLDFLTGKIDESTHDFRFVQDFTGLSEKAVSKINKPFGETLSRIIESERFENLITTYKIFLAFLNKMKVSDDDSPWLELNEDSVVLGTKQAINHFKQEVTLAMNNICEHEQYSRMMELENRSSYRWNDIASVKKEIIHNENEIKQLKEQNQFLKSDVLPTLRKKKR